MRKVHIIALSLVTLAAFAGMQPALADCRSENAACTKGASSPFDSVACGSLYRSCAAHQAITAQQQAKQKHDAVGMQNGNRPAFQNSSGGNNGGGGGGHGRR